MGYRVSLVFCCWIVFAGSLLRAEVITLYDASRGELPGPQGWLQFASNGQGSETGVTGGLRLQTAATAQAGYSNHRPLSTPANPLLVNPAFPSLDREIGFSLSFELRINNEDHTSNDRAGMSIIFLGADRRGIELGFWEDRVFAQNSNPLFTRGEESLLDTTASLQMYALSIQGDEYRLEVDSTPLLSGILRDYTSFTGTPGGIPYSLGNYLFLGDNTTSASVDAMLGSVVLNSRLTAIPEPGSFPVLSMTALIAVRFHWFFSLLFARLRLFERKQ